MFADSLNTKFFYLPFPVKSGLQRIKGDYQPVQRELHRLVQAWFDSGPNVSKLLEANPILARAALRFHAHLIPTKSGRAKLTYTPNPEGMAPGDPLEIALGLFLNFLLNPYNEKLGGPCKHCGKYYVKKTKRQVVYCSKQCGLKHTSQTAIRKYRLQERKEMLEKAKWYLARWTKTKTSKDWKEWVYRETRISKNFLTRAVRNGELIEPVKLA
jgi:hypothetical protein